MVHDVSSLFQCNNSQSEIILQEIPSIYFKDFGNKTAQNTDSLKYDKIREFKEI